MLLLLLLLFLVVVLALLARVLVLVVVVPCCCSCSSCSCSCSCCWLCVCCRVLLRVVLRCAVFRRLGSLCRFVFGRLGSSWGSILVNFARLGGSWAALGGVLGGLWGILGRSWGHLVGLWGGGSFTAASWVDFGGVWASQKGAKTDQKRSKNYVKIYRKNDCMLRRS